ncbi:MAG: 2-amino-4-hydroxy-6-hydroxymethyldihydropteridine diphosphokinase [Rhizomicrobium sp.]
MILIGLGANIPSQAGAPDETLRAALRELRIRAVPVRAVSSLYGSPAWPDPRDPCFVNAVARIETGLDPARLLALLKEIERAFGRVSTSRNAPRPLDLDIVDYDGRIEGGLPTLPHPRMHERAFVLVPLSKIAPDWHHPVTGASVTELIANLPAGAGAVTRLAGWGTGPEPE